MIPSMPHSKGLVAYLNSVPFPFTMKHVFPFDDSTPQLKDGELNSAESWDVLRQSHEHFSISENREEWLKAAQALVKKDGQDGGLVQRAKEVVSLIRRLGVTSVFSAGVGGAGLEYQVKTMLPEVQLTCSEYSPVNVAALKKVFLECDEIIPFDMNVSDWSIALKDVDPERELCLLYRVDIHLTNDEMKRVFERMHAAGIKNVLCIMCGYLTARGILHRFSQRLQWRMHGVKYTFAGYLRTKAAFESFWRQSYTSQEMEFGGLKSFLLTRIPD